MGAFKICSLSNFQLYNTVPLTMVTMLCRRSAKLPSYNWKLYSFTTFTRFPYLTTPTPANINLLSFREFNVFLYSTSKWDYTVFVFLCLTYFSIMPSSFTNVVTMTKVYSFLWLNYIYTHICICIYVHTHICVCVYTHTIFSLSSHIDLDPWICFWCVFPW